MKLRSEVGLLRQHTGELEKALRQTAAPAQNGNAMPPGVMQENARINDAMILCHAMQQYVLQYKQQPADLDQLNAFIRTPLSGIGQFEIVHEQTLAKQPYPEIIIVLREKEARPVSNGKLWERIYGFADGNIKQITSQDGNFTGWEQQHTVPLPNQ